MRVLTVLLLTIVAPLGATDVLVCLGDSLTAGYGVEVEQAFPARLQEKMAGDGLDWRVVNAGVSGDTTAGGLRRIDWVLKAKPSLVLIALGANDGLRGLPVEQMQQNLERMCARLLGAHVRVALAGMQLPASYGEEYRTRFSAVFPAVAARAQVQLMPFLLEGVGGVAELNQGDGLHPTAAGQAVLAEHVYAFLKPLLTPTTSPARGATHTRSAATP